MRSDHEADNRELQKLIDEFDKFNPHWSKGRKSPHKPALQRLLNSYSSVPTLIRIIKLIPGYNEATYNQKINTPSDFEHEFAKVLAYKYNPQRRDTKET